MIQQHSARIFLSDQRSVRQSNTHRAYSTLHPHCSNALPISDFDPLLVFNDEELAGAAVVRMCCDESTQVLLLPITGDLDLTLAAARTCSIAVGELQLFSLPAHTSFLLSNPFDHDIINYLQLCFRTGAALCPPERIGFDLGTAADQLVRLCDLPNFSLSIGRYSGRKQDQYIPSRPDSRLFTFVIAGAFEIEDRLLQPRDALAMKDLRKLEFEALSNGALLLVIELYGQDQSTWT